MSISLEELEVITPHLSLPPERGCCDISTLLVWFQFERIYELRKRRSIRETSYWVLQDGHAGVISNAHEIYNIRLFLQMIFLQLWAGGLDTRTVHVFRCIHEIDHVMINTHMVQTSYC